MARQPFEARYSRSFHLALACIGIGLVLGAGFYMLVFTTVDLTNQRNLWLIGLCALGLLYYSLRSVRFLRDRQAQIVIGPEGIWLGFSRDVQLRWEDVEWVRLRGLRPTLQIGVPPEIYMRLGLSMWNLDDSLTAVRGAGSAVGIRGNGLDRSTRDMLAAIEGWSPGLRAGGRP